jgi:hypothetical protein
MLVARTRRPPTTRGSTPALAEVWRAWRSQLPPPAASWARIAPAHRRARGHRRAPAASRRSWTCCWRPPDDADTSHVLIRLHTALHQIRVMLAHAGAPLAGDRTYGGAGPWPLYLEHVVLGSRVDTTGTWTVWQAPPHEDRERWAPELAAAVDACATTARTTPPPPDAVL